jgi:hypothetical protein
MISWRSHGCHYICVSKFDLNFVYTSIFNTASFPTELNVVFPWESWVINKCWDSLGFVRIFICIHIRLSLSLIQLIFTGVVSKPGTIHPGEWGSMSGCCFVLAVCLLSSGSQWLMAHWLLYHSFPGFWLPHHSLLPFLQLSWLLSVLKLAQVSPGQSTCPWLWGHVFNSASLLSTSQFKKGPSIT